LEAASRAIGRRRGRRGGRDRGRDDGEAGNPEKAPAEVVGISTRTDLVVKTMDNDVKEKKTLPNGEIKTFE